MAQVQVSTEVAPNGSAIAFAFALPGACGWGLSLDFALQRLREDIRWETGWLVQHDLPSPIGLADEPLDFEVVETAVATGEPLHCDTEGFFEIDRQPLVEQRAVEALHLLSLAHGELVSLVSGLSGSELTRPLAPGKRSPGEVVSHVSIAAWWYLTRLPDAPAIPNWQEWPPAPLEQLSRSHELVTDVLRRLANGESHPGHHALNGETWSARKVVRRLVWHELWHLKELTLLQRGM